MDLEKNEGFFRGVYPSHSSKTSEKGLDAKMKDFSGVVPFKFILRRLQNGLGAKVKDFSGSIPFKFF